MLESYLKTKDYSISNENFQLLLDDRIDLLITYPKPKEEDLAKYYESDAYISHKDGQNSMIDRIYQTVKKYTLAKKLELLNSFQVDEKKVLDIGCGTGDFLNTCQKSGWKVTGIEPSEKARNKAQDKLEKGTYIYSDLHAFFEEEESIDKTNLDYKQNYKQTKLYHHNEHETKNIEKEVLKFDMENSDHSTNVFPYQFDVITLWHVLEHVYDLDAYIFKLKKLLKPNGVLVIAVPNFKSYDAEYYKEYWAAYDVPRHLWHFSQTSIHRLFSTEMMKVVKTLPMKFDAFYVSLLSEQYKSGKSGIFNLCKALVMGIKSNHKAKKSGEYSSLIYLIQNLKSD